MKEFPLPFDTNVWNALRYILFTLLVVPLAESLWARAHAKRTGSRASRGSAIKLRRSNLVYWGLHQEVDDKSKLSKVLIIVACLLHVTGTVLLEFGSGSTEVTEYNNVNLSPRFGADVRTSWDAIGYVDISYMMENRVLGKHCIDGKPRSTSDLGLIYERLNNARLVHKKDVEEPQEKYEVVAKMFFTNSGTLVRIHDTATTRSFVFTEQRRNNTYMGLHVKGSRLCWKYFEPNFICETQKGDVNYAKALAQAVAMAAMRPETGAEIFRNGQRKSKLLADLSTARAYNNEMKFDEVYTNWLKTGMPRKSPQGLFRGEATVDLQIKPILRQDCNHAYAVPVTYLTSLKVVERKMPVDTEPRPLPWQGREFAWLMGNKVWTGLIIQLDNESCAGWGLGWVCVSQFKKGFTELRIYGEEDYDLPKIRLNPAGSIQIKGAMSKSDQIDLLIQALLVIYRGRYLLGMGSILEIVEAITDFVQSGSVMAGIVRLSGNSVEGQSAKYVSGRATINSLGIAGAAVLGWLVFMPVIEIFSYVRGDLIDIDRLYRKSIYDGHIHSLTLVHRR